MAGERRLYGLRCGLGVPDLPHHDHVGVLAEDGPQGRSKRDSHPGVYRRLVELFDHHLDGILDGGDVHPVRRQVLKGRIQGGGLAAPRGPSHQDKAVGSGEKPGEAGEGLVGQPQSLQILKQDLGVKDPDHHLLTERHGQGGDAELDVGLQPSGLDSPVLGLSLLRDVQARQRLDPIHHRPMHQNRDPLNGVKQPVDAQSHQGVVSLRFDVYVAGALVERVVQQILHCVHHVLICVLDLIQALQAKELLQVAQVRAHGQVRLGGGEGLAETIDLSNMAMDVTPSAEHEGHLSVHQVPNGLHGLQVERIVRGHPETAPIPVQWKETISSSKRTRQGGGDQRRVQIQRVDLLIGKALAGGHPCGDPVFGEQ